MKKDLIFSLLMTFTVLPYVHLIVQSKKMSTAQQLEEKVAKVKAQTEISREFGFRLDSFSVQHKKVKRGQTLGDILKDAQVDYPDVLKIVENCAGTFQYKNMRSGKLYAIVNTKVTQHNEKYFIYQANPVDYYKVALQGDFKVEKKAKPVALKQRAVSGEITSSLWNALVHNGLSPDLAVELSKIYAWSVNFFALQKGDKFKMIYDEKWVDGELVGHGKIHAAIFEQGGQEYYAIPFEQKEEAGFYDINGKSLEADFLKSPVEFSRISSGFSGRRFHPVLKRWKAHLGTDFAAPTGTPIMSTANGTVIEARFKRNNGNYVKIKHNGDIMTQYLHMSKIGKGIKPGALVKQGDVIGYVGSTGLATGPHVCYRFWMNGKQVNSQAVKISATRKIKEEYQAQFDSVKTIWVKQLRNIRLTKEQEPLIVDGAQTNSQHHAHKQGR